MERHRHPLASRDAAASQPAQPRPFRPSSQPNSTTPPLADHLRRLLAHLRETTELHFWLHGHDLGPIARYLYACTTWGLAPTDALDALSGASPSTARRSTSWPRCGPRSRPRASTLPAWRRSTRCVQCRPASPPSSTSTLPSAATCSSPATTSRRSRSASCPASCWPASHGGAARPSTDHAARSLRRCAPTCPSPSRDASTCCCPTPAA